MIGYRGASRYLSADFADCFAMECEALRYVRDEMGLTNVKVMIPFVRTVAEVQATPRGCALRLWSSPAVEQLRASLHERMADLITDAQAHGTCREGVTVGDLVGVLVALRGVRETPTSSGGLDWRRHLELCLAGLRP